MGVGEWLLAGLVAVLFAFVILRPDRWSRSDRSSSGDGGFYAADSRRDDDGDGGDGDGGGDGGGD